MLYFRLNRKLSSSGDNLITTCFIRFIRSVVRNICERWIILQFLRIELNFNFLSYLTNLWYFIHNHACAADCSLCQQYSSYMQLQKLESKCNQPSCRIYTMYGSLLTLCACNCANLFQNHDTACRRWISTEIDNFALFNTSKISCLLTSPCSQANHIVHIVLIFSSRWIKDDDDN